MKTQRGFTLIELIVVTSITIILLGLITISLVRSQQTASLASVEEILVTDLRQQQLKAMVGDSEGRVGLDQYGIHFDSDRYVLFHGTYSPSDTSNSVINLDANMQFDGPLADVVFSKISGEIPAALTIELKDNTNLRIKKTHLNTFGVITQIETL